MHPRPWACFPRAPPERAEQRERSAFCSAGLAGAAPGGGGWGRVPAAPCPDGARLLTCSPFAGVVPPGVPAGRFAKRFPDGRRRAGPSRARAPFSWMAPGRLSGWRRFGRGGRACLSTAPSGCPRLQLGAGPPVLRRSRGLIRSIRLSCGHYTMETAGFAQRWIRRPGRPTSCPFLLGPLPRRPLPRGVGFSGLVLRPRPQVGRSSVCFQLFFRRGVA